MKDLKRWLFTYGVCCLVFIVGVIGIVVYVDPLMHYHEPLTSKYYYSLDNQRSQNDGIIKHFDYNAVITGTSMAENFKKSEVDKIFGVDSIKVPYSGGSYKELNDSLITALKTHPEVTTIFRCLDGDRFFDSKDAMRTDLGEYPTYLYNNNPFDDVFYVLNRDIIYTRIWNMLNARREGADSGITSFDSYSNWMLNWNFGMNEVLKNDRVVGKRFDEPAEILTLTKDEKSTIAENIETNVTSLADQYPEVDFYYFFPPYSAAWWGYKYEAGLLQKIIDAEQYIIELILPHKNIHLYSWNDRFDITTDLNHYKDPGHYGEWINSWMLVQMKEEKGLLTYDNYMDYLAREKEFYENYQFNDLFCQEDYSEDYYAAVLIDEEIRDVEPLKIDAIFLTDAELHNAQIVRGQYGGSDGIKCTGRLERQVKGETTIGEYLYASEYCGVKFSIDVTNYNTLFFCGKKYRNHGQANVFIYDEHGKILKNYSNRYQDLDDEWHMAYIDISDLKGNVTIIFNGGYIDNSGAEDSGYIFSNIMLY